MNQNDATTKTENTAEVLDIAGIVAKRIENNEGVGTEMAIVREMAKQDSGYLWTWHCNLVMAAIDSGATRAVANDASRRFLLALFNLDVFKDPNYQSELDLANDPAKVTF